MLKPDWKINENCDMSIEFVADSIVVILLPYLGAGLSLSSITLYKIATLADNIHNLVSISY